MVQATIRGFRIASLLLAAYWLLMFLGTHLPHVPMPHVSHGDKILHFLAYAGLGFLLSWAIPTRSDHPLMNVLVAGFCALLYGIVDEFTQIPVGRTADVYDWLADSAGTFIGLVAYVSLRSAIHRFSRLSNRSANGVASLVPLKHGTVEPDPTPMILVSQPN